jgi:hypothetical protein
VISQKLYSYETQNDLSYPKQNAVGLSAFKSSMNLGVLFRLTILRPTSIFDLHF